MNWRTGQLKEGSKGNRWDSTAGSWSSERNELGREKDGKKVEWGFPCVI